MRLLSGIMIILSSACTAQDLREDSTRYAWAEICDTTSNTLDYAKCICDQYAIADRMLALELGRVIGNINTDLAHLRSQEPHDTVEISRLTEIQQLLRTSQSHWEAVRENDQKAVFTMNITGSGRTAIACFEATLETFDRIRRLQEMSP